MNILHDEYFLCPIVIAFSLISHTLPNKANLAKGSPENVGTYHKFAIPSNVSII